MILPHKKKHIRNIDELQRQIMSHEYIFHKTYTLSYRNTEL